MRRLYTFFRIIISIFLIGLLFYIRRDSLYSTLEVIEGFLPGIFFLSLFTFIASTILLAIRFKTLLYGQGVQVSFSESVGLTFIGYFFNNFLPTAIGGDVVKAYYTSIRTEKKIGSFISVFVDRFIGLLSLFMIAAFSLIFTYGDLNTKPLIWITFIMLPFLLFIWILFFSKRTARILAPVITSIKSSRLKTIAEKVYGAVSIYNNKKGILLQAFLLSFLAQLTYFFVIYLLSRGVGEVIPVRLVFLLMPFVSVASMLPSINGLGVREGSIYLLFGPYIGYKNAFTLSLLLLFVLFLVSIIGGFCYLWVMWKRKKSF